MNLPKQALVVTGFLNPFLYTILVVQSIRWAKKTLAHPTIKYF